MERGREREGKGGRGKRKACSKVVSSFLQNISSLHFFLVP